MLRTILHVDMNNFYASVECLYHPELRGKPVAVCGDPEARHGIVLAKNYAAKAYGVKTGNPIWMARQLCPDIVIVPPHYDLYVHFSELARSIYAEYTDLVEPFGLDECWLDVTGSGVFGDGKAIADAIRQRVRGELGITASVGVSFNKVFAKLGSDLKKPDATTVIPYDHWQDTVWPLPVEDLLYVGPATTRSLHRLYVKTVGDLAHMPPASVRARFGKFGVVLQSYAMGLDNSPVSPIGAEPIIKSVGNSTTMPRDMEDGDGLRIVLYILCESVAERLRALGLQCRTVQVSLRGTDLSWCERQAPLAAPSCNATAIYNTAYRLYRNNARGPLRSIGVRGCGLDHWAHVQTSLYQDIIRSQKLDSLDHAVDDIRRRFGRDSVRRGIMLMDRQLAALNPQTDHVAVPPGGR